MMPDGDEKYQPKAPIVVLVPFHLPFYPTNDTTSS